LKYRCPLMTLDTVRHDTPASAATSLMLGRALDFLVPGSSVIKPLLRVHFPGLHSFTGLRQSKICETWRSIDLSQSMITAWVRDHMAWSSSSIAADRAVSTLAIAPTMHCAT